MGLLAQKRLVTKRSMWVLGLLGAVSWLMVSVVGIMGFANGDGIERPKGPSSLKPLGKGIPNPPVVCKVLAVTDGDTFVCDINNDTIADKHTEKVRLLYVDTPETHHSRRNPTGEPQPFGLEAYAFSKAYLLGQSVQLTFDKKPTDRYGRWLAVTKRVVALPSAPSLNEQLVSKGLAKVMIIKPNVAQEAHMLSLETQAKHQKLGVWALPPEFETALIPAVR
jgi:micrococcal nuclease